MQADKSPDKDDINDTLIKYTKSNKRWATTGETRMENSYRDYMGSLTQEFFESGLNN